MEWDKTNGGSGGCAGTVLMGLGPKRSESSLARTQSKGDFMLYSRKLSLTLSSEQSGTPGHVFQEAPSKRTVPEIGGPDQGQAGQGGDHHPEADWW